MRSKAVSYLKCIAAILVINTHLSVLLPEKLHFLAWGGFFANSIFFFVSGYCLTKVKAVFPKWYGKRFVRVYLPYLLALPFLFFAGSLKNLKILEIIIPFKQYHFIPTILFLYIVYYFCNLLNQRTVIKYWMIIVIATIITLIYYFAVYDYKNGFILQHFTFIETVSYLIPMLLGGMAKEGKWIKNKLICLFIAVLSFGLYALQSIHEFEGVFKILQPCIGVFFAYGLCCYVINLENKLPESKIIDLISSVTLEGYIVQFISIQAFKTIGFPTNIIYHIITTIAVAWCLHYISEKIYKKFFNL